MSIRLTNIGNSKSSIYLTFILCFLPVFNIVSQTRPELLDEVLDTDFSYFITSTCKSSTKVDSLVNEIEDKVYYRKRSLEDVDFMSLSSEEHFVYAFKYPERYQQSCMMFFREEDLNKKILAYIPGVGEGYVMSTRQFSAIAADRCNTLGRIRACADSSGYNLDQLRFIELIRAYELIPSLMNHARLRKDYTTNTYLLTTLCLLMKDIYPPFNESRVYPSLYSKSASENFTKSRQRISIPFNKANYNEIMNLAHDYYEWRIKQPKEFVKVVGGRYFLGEEDHPINPHRFVEVEDFEISKYEVTNRQFQQFVESTGYVTLAEQRKDGYTFTPGQNEYEWVLDSTANWRFPNGLKNGGIENKWDHPVTCISYIDAKAYCKWAKVRLPTIEEWEIAARAKTYRAYFFGKTNYLINEYANVWQGKNHLQVMDTDTTIYTTPIGSYKPNPWGLYDIYGNVFEFCENVPDAMKPYENIATTRGGSWWCSKSSCSFFNSVDIGRVQQEASFSNNGFRVVKK